MSWQTVLGFEVHIELGTASKMFCGCPADHFGKPPNTQTCPVCLGLPGALPVPNARAIEWCVKLGLALDCQVNLFSKFDRKNYFYPDLPKGYQISQYDLPFCFGSELLGHRITRVHLEEDTGKLQHSDGKTLIDFNRSGVPLVEIVTEPDFSDTSDAMTFLKEVQAIVRALEISSADMEKGSMRLEANISVRKQGEKTLPNYKIEVKNVNSFRFIKKAIEFETARQIEILESGQIPPQETRGFSEKLGETVSQRSKEEAHDYRYFPEPDIPPIQFTKDQIQTWKSSLPELPQVKRNRLANLGISQSTAATLVASPERYQKFIELSRAHDPLQVANMVANLPDSQVSSASLMEQQNVSDPEKLRLATNQAITNNPQAVADIKSGKQQALFFLIGQIKNQIGPIDVAQAKSAIVEILGL